MNGNSNITNLHTLKDFMRWGASRFMEANLEFAHGMYSAFDESVYLTLRALHLPVDSPEVYWDGKLTDIEKKDVYDLLMRRVNERKPAAYLTNEGWFAGLPFFVDERVLVPRSPIAELVESQFSPWVEAEDVTNILDLCTGSGCIGISCAYAFPYAEIDLSDISDNALDVARINVEKHGVAGKVNIIQSDLFENLQGRTYDIIVSNPPYVDDEDMAHLSQEFLYEPELGLASGPDGLDITRTVLAQAAKHLNPGGILVVEVGNSHFALQEQYPDIPFQWLDFERGGDGVFLLTREQLEANRAKF